jgi:dephospho-CoA kinase
VDKSLKKPIIGVLGGISSGKSTVAAELGKLGCAVIDADEIVHELLNEPEIQQEIVAVFGQEVIETDGKTSRSKLAQASFSDERKLACLNRILHPPVLASTERLIERYGRDPMVRAVVLDMPLLVEVGWEKRCDRLIFVKCEEEKRLERLINPGRSRFFNKNQLKIREKFQIPLDKKESIADYIIDNNSDFSALVRQITGIFNNIMDGR